MANMAGAHLEHSQVAISHPFTVSLRHKVLGLHAMFTFFQPCHQRARLHANGCVRCLQ
jgi:hypothetical protein